jgi:transposase
MIPVAASVRIWIANRPHRHEEADAGFGVTRAEGLGRDPFADNVFVFRLKN